LVDGSGQTVRFCLESVSYRQCIQLGIDPQKETDMKWFSNMKIGNKLIVGFALMVFFTLIVGIGGLKNIIELAKRQQDAYQFNTLPTGLLGTAGDHYQQIRIDLRNAVIAKDKSSVDKFAENVRNEHNAVEEKLVEFDKMIRLPEQKTIYNQLVTDLKGYRPWEDKLLALIRESKDQEAFDILQSDAYKTSTKSIRDGLTKLQEMKADNSKIKATESDAMSRLFVAASG
jgi:methyl-accepting chemotaxis protein